MEEKKWYESKSILASIVALVAIVVGAFGFAMDADDQASLVEIALQAASGVGVVIAIYGRITASKVIK